MNRTQKGAWLNMVGTLLVLASALHHTIQIGVKHKPPELIWILIWMPAIILVTIVGLFLIRKKQSPAEPESDERDNQIQHRAILVAFFSAIPIFLLASAAPSLFVGNDGYVPVWSLPLVTLFLFSVVLIIYSVAILVQYARGGKGEKS